MMSRVCDKCGWKLSGPKGHGFVTENNELLCGKCAHPKQGRPRFFRRRKGGK